MHACRLREMVRIKAGRKRVYLGAVVATRSGGQGAAGHLWNKQRIESDFSFFLSMLAKTCGYGGRVGEGPIFPRHEADACPALRQREKRKGSAFVASGRELYIFKI